MQEMGVQSPGQEDALEKEMIPTEGSSLHFLCLLQAGGFFTTESLGTQNPRGVTLGHGTLISLGLSFFV